MTVALIFAGQGAEEPGMGLAFSRASADAAALLEAASDATGVDVTRALERGGRALARTEILQPAMVAVGLAAAAALERSGVEPTWVCGHSLGELTAAAWAARLDPATAIELAAVRGREMARAIAESPGSMLALRSGREEVEAALAALPAEHGEAVVAAFNAPDETVVSGDLAALDALSAHFGARAQRLRVAGAWHSSRLESALPPFRKRLEDRLAHVTLRARLLSTCSAADEPASALPRVLSEGLVRPVRFVEVLERLRDEGVRHFVVTAPSRTLRSLARRVLGRRAEIHRADDPASVAATAARLGVG